MGISQRGSSSGEGVCFGFSGADDIRNPFLKQGFSLALAPVWLARQLPALSVLSARHSSCPDAHPWPRPRICCVPRGPHSVRELRVVRGRRIGPPRRGRAAAGGLGGVVRQERIAHVVAHRPVLPRWLLRYCLRPKVLSQHLLHRPGAGLGERRQGQDRLDGRQAPGVEMPITEEPWHLVRQARVLTQELGETMPDLEQTLLPAPSAPLRLIGRL